MKIFKNLSLVILSLVLFSACADAQVKKKAANKKTPAKTSKTAAKKPVATPTAPTAYKVLVEGQYSRIDIPFLLIARDAETYALIRTLVEGLPASSTIDFSKTAVVAAFAGQRNSGGWTVGIRPIPNKTVIDLNRPPKGSMTTQAISYPFQVALVPVSETEPLSVDLTATWINRMSVYRVAKSDFESSGGIAGRIKKFSAEGTIGVLNFGEIVTYIFDLSGAGNDQAMKLTEVASGVARAGNVELTRLEAATFADTPHPPLKVFGTANGSKLSLIFESHPPTIADGFMVRGKLDAVKSK
jgi:hypothetical protein